MLRPLACSLLRSIVPGLFAALAVWALTGAVEVRAEAAAASTSAPTKADLDEIVAKRKQLATRIEELAKQNGSRADDADPTDVSAAEDEQEYLETLDAVYGQQQARFEQRQELQAAKAKADAELESLHKFGPTEAKPYSFLLLERLRDELSAEEDHAEAQTADLKAAEQLLASAQEHLDEAEKERRHAQEEVDENEDKDQQAALADALRLAKRQSEIAKELIVLRRLEVESRTLRKELCAVRTNILTEKTERIGKDVHFTKHDLQERLKDLTEYDVELNSDLKQARVSFQQDESRQNTAVAELRKQQAPQATLDLANESWRVARDAQQMAITLLSERIGDNKRFRHYWACRYEVENGTAKPAEIAEWHESLSDLVDEIHDNERSLEQRIDTTRVEQAKMVQRMRNDEDAAVKEWGEYRCLQWQKLRDACEDHLVQLKASERWASRFLEELHDKLEPEGEPWTAVLQKNLAVVWDFEIAHVEERPISVGKVLTLVLYIIVGVVAASVFSRVLGRIVHSRFGLNEGASHAVTSIAFYSSAVLFGVLSFQLVHIPLSAFAFLGGAVAIAIGFGSQEIASNFMSGIILLAEQPIRVGDVVNVDGTQGTVKHIGARSTRIRTDLNHELIVPNSKLLSDKVTNLTLSDDLVQTAVAVSLPIKLNVRTAKHLLLQAASMHQTVLREPAPVVLFKQFGTSMMDFELHFWLELDDDMRAAIVQSEVRESINDLFQQIDAPATIAPAPLRKAA